MISQELTAQNPHIQPLAREPTPRFRCWRYRFRGNVGQGRGSEFMKRDLSQRVLRQGSPAPHLAYSRPIKSNAKPARTLTWRFGKPKLIAEAVLYSLFVLSPTKLFVGHCARPDT